MPGSDRNLRPNSRDQIVGLRCQGGGPRFHRKVDRTGLAERGFEFSVQRAVYMTVLHRLFVSGSDRAAERWREEYRIPGTE